MCSHFAQPGAADSHVLRSSDFDALSAISSPDSSASRTQHIAEAICAQKGLLLWQTRERSFFWSIGGLPLPPISDPATTSIPSCRSVSRAEPSPEVPLDAAQPSTCRALTNAGQPVRSARAVRWWPVGVA
jgi:hypothetical protein